MPSLGCPLVYIFLHDVGHHGTLLASIDHEEPQDIIDEAIFHDSTSPVPLLWAALSRDSGSRFSGVARLNGLCLRAAPLAALGTALSVSNTPRPNEDLNHWVQSHSVILVRFPRHNTRLGVYHKYSESLGGLELLFVCSGNSFGCTLKGLKKSNTLLIDFSPADGYGFLRVGYGPDPCYFLDMGY